MSIRPTSHFDQDVLSILPSLYLLKSHNTPLLPPKHLHRHYFDLSMSQEKLQTMIIQDLGDKRCIMGFEKVENHMEDRNAYWH